MQDVPHFFQSTLFCCPTTTPSLLVIDDLPDPVENGSLFGTLAFIVKHLSSVGHKLITTSQRPLPPELAILLADKIVTIKPPDFSMEEVKVALTLSGAPHMMLTDGIARLISGLSNGHAAFVMATVQWLKRNSWELDPDRFGALLKGEPLEDMRDFERRRMVRLLDANSRQYMYRLSLIDTHFDTDMALAVASVDPVLDYPGELLSGLIGPWIARLKNERLEVTPLLRDAGRLNLPEDLRHRIHKKIAKQYLSSGAISASEILHLTLHLKAANEVHESFSLLIQFMYAAKSTEQAQQIEWMASVYLPDVGWPQEIDLSTRIIFRSAQIRLASLINHSIDSLNADFVNLISQAGDSEQNALLLAYITVGPMLEAIDPLTGFTRAIEALKIIRRSPEIFREDELRPFIWEEIAWFPVTRAKATKAVLAIISVIANLQPEERNRLFSVEWAEEAVSHLVNRIWLNEDQKPKEQRDWTNVLRDLEQVARIGELVGCNPLQIAQIRAKAIVYSDYLDDKDRAIQILQEALKAPTVFAKFLLNFTAGGILYDAKQFDKAFRYYEAAINADYGGLIYGKVECRKRMIMTLSKIQEWERSRLCCIDALLSLHQNIDVVDEIYERMELLGEWSYIEWRSGRQIGTCRVMYGLVRALITQDISTTRYRETFNKTVHALSWYCTLALTGAPPPDGSDGGEFVPVHSGFFGERREQIGKYESPLGSPQAILLTQLANLASTFHRPRLTWRMLRGLRKVELGSDKLYMQNLYFRLAPLHVLFGNPDEALSVTISAIRAATVGQKLVQQRVDGSELLMANANPQWDSLTINEQKEGESLILYLCFGPLFSNLLSAPALLKDVVFQLATWEKAVIQRYHEFVDGERWLKFIQQFRTLLESRGLSGDKLVSNQSIESEMLQMFLQWVLALEDSKNFGEILNRQVRILKYIVRIKQLDINNCMNYCFNKYLHQFWLKAVSTYAFALRSPKLFGTELKKVRPDARAVTTIRIIRLAAFAVDARIGEELLTLFRRLEADTTN